jgi:phospholipid-binding lipoprotein MlaA
VAVAALLGLSACAGTPGQTTDSDPLEPFNRAVFTLNQAADTVAIRPVSVAYRDIVPDPFKDGIRNVLRNLRTPLILVNEALQGDWEGVDTAATRLFVNSTLGLGGWVDIAGEHLDKPFNAEDFGQTLAVYGIDSGPYLVLPLIGPSTLRDTAGRGAEIAADPFNNVWQEGLLDGIDGASLARTGLTIVDTRARSIEALDELERSSFDYYAAVRSLYVQNRRAQISEGEGETLEIPTYEDVPSFEEDEGQEGEPSGAAVPPDGSVATSSAQPSDAPEALMESVSSLPPLELDLAPVGR